MIFKKHFLYKIQLAIAINLISSSSLSAHNYVKLSSLQSNTSVYKHDVIFLSETYVDNSVLSDKSDLNFPHWLGLTVQEILKEQEYGFTLKSPYLHAF